MPSIKSLALCLAVGLIATATADAQPISRNLRAQHQSDTPHAETSPGIPTTTVNVAPSTVTTNVNVAPGTVTTTINGGATQAAVVAAPAAAAQPSAGGLDFGSLLGGGNPLTGVATMAHVAHGALLGHTGTLPSSYMEGQGGGH